MSLSSLRSTRIAGFTLVEILVVLGLIGVLISIAVPVYKWNQERQKVNAAILDISVVALALKGIELDNREFPAELPEDLRKLDPWGNPYQYLRMQGASNGAKRKDKSLVPINTDFDLYSMGPDGRSVGPLTAKQSRDDIVRAANGRFIGIGADF
ncbi:prepilin-type N-terminal cleavage/methylation domain-containing protein [Pseudorhodoferax sp. Leaf265]|jgi:general secretion pathway protein G|uniref:prepilin-type N-terminal cleavage/methylation domain-containing protein n=1 Tax=Pseudorhodoferax sp. Leaf265 TaxID=1736315 RepID=UPI0009E79A24|nr:prepilin-type N-terminal cleavage/methylation domain-containing protein [Pseudorhodoferax sp. Leaf265]